MKKRRLLIALALIAILACSLGVDECNRVEGEDLLNQGAAD